MAPQIACFWRIEGETNGVNEGQLASDKTPTPLVKPPNPKILDRIN